MVSSLRVFVLCALVCVVTAQCGTAPAQRIDCGHVGTDQQVKKTGHSLYLPLSLSLSSELSSVLNKAQLRRMRLYLHFYQL
jgi:hypothetical protein